MADPGPAFRPQEILAILERHGVEYVLIGGLAAALHGAAYVTQDVDVTPKQDLANLDRLSAALSELGAATRFDREPCRLPFRHDGASLGRARVWNLTTRYGDLDLSFVPSGTGGYDDLRRDAVAVDLRGTTTLLASLADVVRSKEAAGRDKDRLVLPTLRALLERQLAARRRKAGSDESG